jgi:glucose-6-phosphate 1-dehydrogenase
MPMTVNEVIVKFDKPPISTFGENVSGGYVRVRLSPDIFLALGLRVKRPGERMVGEDVELTLSESAASMKPPYQRLLGDAMRGDSELFGRQDIIEAQWRIVEPILRDPPPVLEYEPGTWGPDAAEALIDTYGPWQDPKPPAKA